MVYGVQLPKPVRQVDERYLAFVRLAGCAVCNREDADAHHRVTRGAGGGDYTAVPLCRQHHGELHQIGLMRFEDQYGICLAAVNVLVLSSYLSSIMEADDA